MSDRRIPSPTIMQEFSRTAWRIAILALLAVFTGKAALAREDSAACVEGIEEGAIYFQPVTPEVVVPEGLTVTAKTLNGQPYDGGEIAEQGLYTLEVRASDQQHVEQSSTTRFWVLDPSKRGPTYTTEMVRYHVGRLARRPFVTPTRSGDPQLVVGKSLGWPKDPAVPVHELYGLQITDPDSKQAKIHVVLVGGNHPREQTGSWALQGALDFLVSDDPRAEDLRRWVTFLVYPMVNPDGRYALSGRSNPEMRAEKMTDHNRVWNTSGRFSTIDAITQAIRTDSGGTVEYLLDFHSAGSTFFFTGPELMTSPYAQAMTVREPEVAPRRSQGHPGMIRNWSMSEEGLGAPFAYTPELAGGENAKRSMEVGRAFLLTFHDLISGEAALAAASKLLDEKAATALGEKYRRRIPELKENVERRLAAGEPPVNQILEDVYALYAGINDYREFMDLAAEGKRLTASAQQFAEEPTLSIGTWLPESLLAEIGELTECLADPEAEIDQLRARNQTLSGLLDAVRLAELAEAAVSGAAEILDKSLDGFGLLVQNAIRKGHDSLVELLKTPGTTGQRYRQATESLNESIASYWQIRPGAPFPAVSPVSVDGSDVVVELRTQADWEDGFLVHVAAKDDGLVPADQPVLVFGGDGDHVETGFIPGETTLGQQFTWEFWKRYRVFADATGSSGNRGTPLRFYTQLSGTDGSFRTAIGDAFWTATTLEELDRWYHFAIVFDQGEVRTYVDGDLKNTRGDVTFSGDSSSPFAIGRGFGDGRWLDGYTRDHRIWQVARSQAEIRRNRHRQYDGSEPGLVGYWPLDEGENDTAHDRSASANHGTITGAVWTTHAIGGYRLSQPLAFAGTPEAPEVTVTWEVAAEDNNGADHVTVSFGLSGDATALPTTWHPATNGKPLQAGKEALQPAGRHLWLKQVLTPSAPESPVKLQRLSVEVK